MRLEEFERALVNACEILNIGSGSYNKNPLAQLWNTVVGCLVELKAHIVT